MESLNTTIIHAQCYNEAHTTPSSGDAKATSTVASSRLGATASAPTPTAKMNGLAGRSDGSQGWMAGGTWVAIGMAVAVANVGW